MCALFSREPSPRWKNLNDNVLPPLASGFQSLILLFFFAITLLSAISPGPGAPVAGMFIFAAFIGSALFLILAGWVLYLTKQYLLSFLAFIPVAILTFPVGALQVPIARKAYNKWKGKE